MNWFLDIDYANICKDKQKIAGDVFLLSRDDDQGKIVCTLSDGLGSGVKANVLANLTAHMAQKLSFSPMNLLHSAEIIMNTLPVCRERKISYSTFSLASINLGHDDDIRARLVEYDNPAAMLFRNDELLSFGKEQFTLNRAAAFKEEQLSCAEISLKPGDRLVLFTDGVTQAGMGTPFFPLGWRHEGAKKFISREIQRNPHISSADLAQFICRQAYSIDRYAPKDDITCAVMYVRKPRRTVVATGPPMDPRKDALLVKKIADFPGKKIISGGTTAQIYGSRSGCEVRVNLHDRSTKVPPTSRAEGVDLITEGMLTLIETANILEQRLPAGDLPDNGAAKLADMLLNSDRVHFIVGTKINDAHQDPNVPVEIGIRRTIVKRIRDALERNYLKETSLEYL
ncbi:MAG: serine/threonine-protein phosphatase [Spirochaetia bacterium]|nr:serine/threonine-protein phosphatase [Spirochaetia bacterium]